MDSWYELAIIAFILTSIGVIVWRGGAANPVPTGKLDKELASVAGELGALGAKVNEIEKQVEDIDRRAASKNDIKRLEQKMAAHDAKMDEIAAGVAGLRETIAGRTGKVDAMARQLDRLMDIIVEKGMER